MGIKPGVEPESADQSVPPLILHVIHHLAIGGMENGLVNLINVMPSGRFRHAIACVEDYSDFRDRIQRPDVEVFALHRSQVGLFGLRKSLFRLCRRLRPAIVHSRNTSALDALLPARLAGVKHFVHGEHGWDVNDLDGNKRKPVILRQLHSPLISRYITVSQQLRDYLITRVGIKGNRISQIYNGVDTGRFQPVQEKPLSLLPRDFAGPQSIIIGTVGRIQPVKDQATLLRAFANRLAEQPALRDRLRLVVVGDGPLLAQLRVLAAELKIEPYTWMPGAAANVHELVGLFDLFVLPSLAEGISNTVLEAMASGVPVIASRVGGNPELVTDGQVGRLFEAGDDLSLSRILADYAASDALLHDHGRQARQTAQEQFALSAMVANYQAVYERFCPTGQH